MPSLSFSDLLVLTAGELAQIQSVQAMPEHCLEELLAQLTPGTALTTVTVPTIVLQEIEIELPVHFGMSAQGQSDQRLMVTLPSPLIPDSTRTCSRFRVTLNPAP